MTQTQPAFAIASMPTLTPETPVGEALALLPGAKRALFARYHIGGCNKCAYQPEETLSALCARNEDIDVQEMIDHLLASHAEDQKLLIEPIDLKAVLSMGLDSGGAAVIDLRLREEHDAVKLPGSLLKTQDLMTEIFSAWPKERHIVLYDHRGTGSALDAAAYFVGHGFTEAKALRGGIDAYAVEVDPSIERYQIEFE